MRERRKDLKLSPYITIVLIVCITFGVFLHIVPFSFNGSLWIDEAMLASSVISRSYKTMLASPLDFGQSAAPGWLFIVKTLTLMFGTSEYVLRSWSLISSLGAILLVFLLMRNRMRKNYPLLFTAIFSLTDGYISFSCEAKPYMSDSMFSLLALYLWQKYREKKISLLWLTVIYAILVWFSFTAVFFIAACMIIECVGLIRSMIKTKTVSSGLAGLLKCALVLLSFIAYYVIWLSKTAGNAGGGGYWELLRFPLIPRSLSDLKLIFRMRTEFVKFFPEYVSILLCVLGIMYIVNVLVNRRDLSRILLPSVIALFIVLVASFLGFYPIQDRLLGVFGIILLILSAYMSGEIEESFGDGVITLKKDCCWGKLLFYAVLILVVIITGKGGCANLSKDHVYRSGSQVEESMNYIGANTTGSDVLYVYRQSLPVYMYETGYSVDYSFLDGLRPNGAEAANADDQLKGLPIRIGNRIFGQKLIAYDYKVPYSYKGQVITEAVVQDAAMISACDSVYLLTSHRSEGIPELIDELNKTGVVTTVVSSYDTYLYHYIRENLQ